MIDMMDALRLIESRREDAVVIPVMMGNLGWREVTRNKSLDLPTGGSMGKASSLALGLCLARPDKKVVVLDGDGSLLMNLGSMVTISNTAPKNLIHVLFNNKVYAVTGGQPIPGAEKADWEGMAKSAGYASVFSFDNLEDLTNGIDEAMAAVGPVFIHLVVKPEIENTPVQFRTPAKRNVHTAIADLPETLGVKH